MNIGILGVGSFGEKHIHVLKNIKNFNLVGFFEPKKNRAIEIEKKLGVSSYDDIQELIKKCDALNIVSDTFTHFELLKLLTIENKHIFIEKPICSNQDEINTILTLTKNYKKIIQVGHIERYNPVIKSESIESREINSIIAKRTGLINDRNKSTSITLDLMIHDIDLVVNIMHSNVIKIEASGKNKDNGSYNYVTCMLYFENGKQAKLISERGEKIDTERIIQINCMNQIIDMDLLKRKKTTKKDEQEVVESFNNSNPLEEELIDFYNNIANNQAPIVGVKDACYATQIALKIDNQIGNRI